MGIFIKKYHKGILAELLVSFLLMTKGFKILARRYKTPVGEIDIIAKRFNQVLFAEVKYRKTAEEAAYSISEHQKKRIERAAQFFIASKNANFDRFSYRFDAFLVAPWSFPVHIKAI